MESLLSHWGDKKEICSVVRLSKSVALRLRQQPFIHNLCLVKIFWLVLYNWGSSDGEPKISQDPMETVKEQYLQDGDQNTLKMLA
jgi:hypothetical protein